MLAAVQVHLLAAILNEHWMRAIAHSSGKLQISRSFKLKFTSPQRKNVGVKALIHVTDAKVAAVFSNSRQRNLVLRLINHERSLQEFADESGLSLSLLHYHVSKLQNLGVVEVVRCKARAGRSIKIFQSTARAFFVPALLMSQLPEDKLYAELRACMDRYRTRAKDEGILYFIDAQAVPRMRKIGKTAIPGAEFWLRIRLSNADAQSLAQEMKLLLKRYERRGVSPDRSYLVHCVMVPK